MQNYTPGFPFVHLSSVMLRPQTLDSETGWTGELGSSTNLLKWQNYENLIFSSSSDFRFFLDFRFLRCLYIYNFMAVIQCLMFFFLIMLFWVF